MFVYVLIWVSVTNGFLQRTVNVDVPFSFSTAEACFDKLSVIESKNEGQGRCVKVRVE